MQQQGGRDAGQPRLYWVNEMKDKNDNTDAASLRGILGGPVMLAAALLVFLVAAQISGQNGWMDETNLLALPVVAALGAVVGSVQLHGHHSLRDLKILCARRSVAVAPHPKPTQARPVLTCRQGLSEHVHRHCRGRLTHKVVPVLVAGAQRLVEGPY